MIRSIALAIALGLAAASANAAQPLTEKQMDKVTAGWDGSSGAFFASVLTAIANNPGALSSVSSSSSSSP